MLEFANDQAESLRRIMAKPAPKIVCVLSAALEGNPPLLLTNLAAAISTNHNHVLLVHAGQESSEASRIYGTNALPTLVDVAQEKYTLAHAVKNSKLGFSVTKLQPKNQNLLPLEDAVELQTSELLNDLANRYTLVLVDGALNKSNTLPAGALSEGQLLIQLTREPESIKRAYILIKHVYQAFGRAKFGIVVTGASDAHAAVVFRNIAQVAKQFLAINLEFFGAIPADEHINRAAKLGRNVTNAFPQVAASIAFKSLAQRLNYTQTSSAQVELTSLA